MTVHMRVDQHLFALAQRVRAYDGVTTNLQDNVLNIAELGGGRVERISCAPYGRDGGRLWLFASDRTAIAPVESPDAPLMIVRRLRERRS